MVLSSDDNVTLAWLNRQFAYDQNGGQAIIPVDREPAGVIPPAGFDPESQYSNVTRELREISRDFRLIYDPLTRGKDQPPWMGLHVYTVFEGMLVLEASCMKNIGCNKPECSLCWPGMEWPNGIPCSPTQAWNGRGIVAFIKAHDKARNGLSRHRNAFESGMTRRQRNAAKAEKIKQQSREVAQFWWDEATTMLSRHGGPSSSGRIRFRGNKAHLNRLPTAIPKTKGNRKEPTILLAS